MRFSASDAAKYAARLVELGFDDLTALLEDVTEEDGSVRLSLDDIEDVPKSLKRFSVKAQEYMQASLTRHFDSPPRIFHTPDVPILIDRNLLLNWGLAEYHAHRILRVAQGVAECAAVQGARVYDHARRRALR